ncbi:protein-L-isoaspartate(D-aspartate) O-methyltransferase [Rivibacter subsaxonicus]|uniref:Protein-L-isoaspartate O-methyltransferase n=1 Tax=Rivibacter subsaxonicus TaxID=457575 RepID=A0A4Q7VNQ5_9BURK|nr:protein-L-isoaspartate(D-aspartate) O-methyltransferase [Rivibacter subsaxonicus]RZT98020.1 protein-L-isoaspartate(D-aspartate) O-methyltransferase [Rivibacter subsaxonicus]
MTSTPPRRFPLSLSQVVARDGGSEVLRPQRPVDDAARERSRSMQPAGVGLDSHSVRERLVERLVREGLRDERVIAALRAVPRHRFVDSALVQQAYEDTSLPIGLGQTISKPSVVARMLALMLAPHAATARLRVLEIGTGCGYQAALIACFSRSVVSIERLKPLHDKARANLLAIDAGDVRLVYGDGRLGHAPNAPYDAIIAAAGGDDVPAPWLEQLAVGGRLVAPSGDGSGAGQVLVVVDRLADGRLQRSVHEAVRFVPLKSGLA